MENKESLGLQDPNLQSQQALRYEATLKRIADELGSHLDESQIVQTAMRELALALKAAYFNSAEHTLVSDLSSINSTDSLLSALEMQLVQQVATTCVSAIRQARLYQAQKARIEEQEKLNRFKDDFLSTVAHELRSPMTSIRLATQTLQRLVSVGRTQCGELANLNSHCCKSVAYIQILQDECQREINLINDLLDLQQLEAGPESLELTTLELPDCIEDVAQRFQRIAQSRQQSLNIELEPNFPPLVTHPIYLSRILSELLNNACKYTPPFGTISLKAFTESKTFRLQISNSGVEISLDELPRIFEKFYRIPKGDPWKQGGTGLGLAIVKGLVEHLGGEISVKSAAGQTCFIVEMPISYAT